MQHPNFHAPTHVRVKFRVQSHVLGELSLPPGTRCSSNSFLGVFFSVGARRSSTEYTGLGEPLPKHRFLPQTLEPSYFWRISVASTHRSHAPSPSAGGTGRQVFINLVRRCVALWAFINLWLAVYGVLGFVCRNLELRDHFTSFHVAEEVVYKPPGYIWLAYVPIVQCHPVQRSIHIVQETRPLPDALYVALRFGKETRHPHIVPPSAVAYIDCKMLVETFRSLYRSIRCELLLPEVFVGRVSQLRARSGGEPPRIPLPLQYRTRCMRVRPRTGPYSCQTKSSTQGSFIPALHSFRHPST